MGKHNSNPRTPDVVWKEAMVQLKEEMAQLLSIPAVNTHCHELSDKILESLVSGTRTKATVTSRYLNTTVSNNSCHQASHQQSQLRLAILRIANPLE